MTEHHMKTDFLLFLAIFASLIGYATAAETLAVLGLVFGGAALLCCLIVMGGGLIVFAFLMMSGNKVKEILV